MFRHIFQWAAYLKNKPSQTLRPQINIGMSTRTVNTLISFLFIAPYPRGFVFGKYGAASIAQATRRPARRVGPRRLLLRVSFSARAFFRLYHNLRQQEKRGRTARFSLAFLFSRSLFSLLLIHSATIPVIAAAMRAVNHTAGRFQVTKLTTSPVASENSTA